jgi:hypothetical protein
MRQAITTKYIGPTNNRGSRVKAVAAGGCVTLGWDDSLNPNANHRAGASALASKLGWHGHWVAGGHHDGSVIWIDASDLEDSFVTERRVRA